MLSLIWVFILLFNFCVLEDLKQPHQCGHWKETVKAVCYQQNTAVNPYCISKSVLRCLSLDGNPELLRKCALFLMPLPPLRRRKARNIQNFNPEDDCIQVQLAKSDFLDCVQLVKQSKKCSTTFKHTEGQRNKRSHVFDEDEDDEAYQESNTNENETNPSSALLNGKQGPKKEPKDPQTVINVFNLDQESEKQEATTTSVFVKLNYKAIDVYGVSKEKLMRCNDLRKANLDKCTNATGHQKSVENKPIFFLEHIGMTTCGQINAIRRCYENKTELADCMNLLLKPLPPRVTFESVDTKKVSLEMYPYVFCYAQELLSLDFNQTHLERNNKSSTSVPSDPGKQSATIYRNEPIATATAANLPSQFRTVQSTTQSPSSVLRKVSTSVTKLFTRSPSTMAELERCDALVYKTMLQCKFPMVPDDEEPNCCLVNNGTVCLNKSPDVKECLKIMVAPLPHFPKRSPDSFTIKTIKQTVKDYKYCQEQKLPCEEINRRNAMKRTTTEEPITPAKRLAACDSLRKTKIKDCSSMIKINFTLPECCYVNTLSQCLQHTEGLEECMSLLLGPLPDITGKPEEARLVKMVEKSVYELRHCKEFPPKC